MTKRIVFFLVAITLLFFIGVFLHQYLNSVNENISRFSEISIYGFHAVASSIVYILIEICFKYLPSQTGYSFLALMTIKLGVFMLIYSSNIYNGLSLNSSEKLVLVAPLFIFLITETIALALLLNSASFHLDKDS